MESALHFTQKKLNSYKILNKISDIIDIFCLSLLLVHLNVN